VYIRYSFFRDLTQRHLVVTDVSGEPTGPIFEGQTVQDECQKSWVGIYIRNGVGGDWFSGIETSQLD
jgi:hypothetical protein